MSDVNDSSSIDSDSSNSSSSPCSSDAFNSIPKSQLRFNLSRSCGSNSYGAPNKDEDFDSLRIALGNGIRKGSTLIEESFGKSSVVFKSASRPDSATPFTLGPYRERNAQHKSTIACLSERKTDHPSNSTSVQPSPRRSHIAEHSRNCVQQANSLETETETTRKEQEEAERFLEERENELYDRLTNYIARTEKNEEEWMKRTLEVTEEELRQWMNQTHEAKEKEVEKTMREELEAKILEIEDAKRRKKKVILNELTIGERFLELKRKEIGEAERFLQATRNELKEAERFLQNKKKEMEEADKNEMEALNAWKKRNLEAKIKMLEEWWKRTREAKKNELEEEIKRKLASKRENAVGSCSYQSRSESEPWECPVCYKSKSAAIQLCSTPCGHIFCHACIAQVADSSAKCPLCKKRFMKNQIISLYF